MGEGHARSSAATVAVLAVGKTVSRLCVTALLWLGAKSGAWAGNEAVANRRWAIAVYGGALTQHSLIESFINPDPRWTTSYIAAVDVSYVVYRSHTLPLEIEIDATIAKRVGASGSKATRAKWRAHAEAIPSLSGASNRRGRVPSGLRSHDVVADAESVGLTLKIHAGTNY